MLRTKLLQIFESSNREGLFCEDFFAEGWEEGECRARAELSLWGVPAALSGDASRACSVGSLRALRTHSAPVALSPLKRSALLRAKPAPIKHRKVRPTKRNAPLRAKPAPIEHRKVRPTKRSALQSAMVVALGDAHASKLLSKASLLYKFCRYKLYIFVY